MLKLISQNTQLDEWDFLYKWNSMTPEEQIKKYDKYISHEFNLFAYFKDKDFFDLVVKPHILNKSKKQLIDYFLLGNEQELKTYLHPVTFKDLSAIEQGLLVQFFSAKEKDICASIADNFKKTIDSQYHDIKEFKRLFDSVLKAQVNKESPVLLGNLSNMNMMGQPMMQNMMMQNIAPMSNFGGLVVPCQCSRWDKKGLERPPSRCRCNNEVGMLPRGGMNRAMPMRAPQMEMENCLSFNAK
jgi:hypothetical protein